LGFSDLFKHLLDELEQAPTHPQRLARAYKMAADLIPIKEKIMKELGGREGGREEELVSA